MSRTVFDTYRKYPACPHISTAPGNLGTRAYELAQKHAENGSEILRLAIERQFEGFARRYRITEEEARILLLDTGVRLPRPFMLDRQ